MRCTYVARVNAGEWWPRTSWTCFAFHPARKNADAAVWRNVWYDAHGTPARRAAGLRTRLVTFDWSIIRPVSDTRGARRRRGRERAATASAPSPSTVARRGGRTSTSGAQTRCGTSAVAPERGDGQGRRRRPGARLPRRSVAVCARNRKNSHSLSGMAARSASSSTGVSAFTFSSSASPAVAVATRTPRLDSSE